MSNDSAEIAKVAADVLKKLSGLSAEAKAAVVNFITRALSIEADSKAKTEDK
jgi:hypothetical protein